MKIILAFLFCAFITVSLTAQQFKGLDNLPMKTDEDFKKAEPTIKDCVKYILSHPVDKNDESGQNANRFLIKWMTGTPDYSFGVDGDAVKYTKKDELLLAAFMASMVRVVLDKPELAKDQKAMKIAAFKVFADYCADDKNKVTRTADIKKLIEANKKGKIESALDMSEIK